ncbi:MULTISPECIES: phosphatase PAP2 family protein [unclassified Brenneria]|uniref:phosphatase PAP2 family protein n=1 Tax=unclassified Brenneria TaxID=2634434 RepID=UPI0029C3F7BD|nr:MULTISPECIES: phosphatase PAP2 family protein [unclassified Brenneria]MDX5630282.1 phosphatase PAP2 family protein [Brenneria sp. L3-3Z]MDX5697427.1 phosphatase PAP2 family protein [Brenneria sp. L4-2C]
MKADRSVAMSRHGEISNRCYLALIVLIWLWGVVSALSLRDARFIAPGALSMLVIILQARATAAGAGTWRSWLGVLQFASSWLVFYLFRAIHLATPRSFDAQLLMWDRMLFGGGGATEKVAAWHTFWLSEVMSLCYIAFYFIILLPVIVYACRRTTLASRGFFHGLMLMYLFGFLGYLLVPAGGPYLQFPDQFPYPPEGGAITAFQVALVAQGGTGMDVFPSLHCGISVYILGYLLLQRHTLIAVLLFPVVAGLVLATLYLLYHYGIDLIAGALLACAVLGWLHRCGYFRDDAALRI